MADLLPAEIGGRYRVLRCIAQGGMGSIYEATDSSSGQKVAIKVLMSDLARSPTLMGRFEREVAAVAELATPHVVRMLSAGTDPGLGLPFMVMEYLEGEDLQQLIERLGPLPTELALRVAAQACLALQVAHARQILHRDIKPANLFLARGEGGERVIKLLDFGVAKVRPEPSQLNAHTAALTGSGNMLGSPRYISPEQARGHKDIDARADLWSLSVALYQALAGRTPHADIRDLGELLVVLCTEPSEPLQDVAPWVLPEIASIVHRNLRFRAEERFASATDMLAALRRVLPGDVSITEAMVRPLTDEERRRCAPRLTESLADAPPPVRRIKAAGTKPSAEASLPVPSGKGTEPPAGRPPPALPARPARSEGPAVKPAPAWRAVVGMASAAVAGGLLAYQTMRPAPSREPPRAASTAAPRGGAVSLVVRPPSVSVTIDGLPATAQGGLVAIPGAPGSVHKVRISSGEAAKSAEVRVTDRGADPPELSLDP